MFRGTILATIQTLIKDYTKIAQNNYVSVQVMEEIESTLAIKSQSNLTH